MSKLYDKYIQETNNKTSSSSPLYNKFLQSKVKAGGNLYNQYLERKKTGTVQNTDKKKGGIVAPVEQPKTSILGAAKKKVVDFMSGESNFTSTDYDKAPGYKPNLFKDTAREILSGENIPFGIGQLIKSARTEPETWDNVTASDVLTGLTETGKGLVKYPASVVSNFAGVPIKFDIPGLGEVTNRQFNAAQRIKNGEDPTVVTIEEGAGGILDTLFLVGMLYKVAGPRSETIAKTTISKDSGITFKGPETGRLYTDPVVTKPVSPQMMSKIPSEQMTGTYDPKLPTFFRMSGKGTTGNITGEIVQIKPSYIETFWNKLKGDFSQVPPEQVNVLTGKTTTMKALETTKAQPANTTKMKVADIAQEQFYPTQGKSLPLSDSEIATVLKDNPGLDVAMKNGTAPPIPVKLIDGKYVPYGDGATRYMAAKALGLENINVIKVGETPATVPAPVTPVTQPPAIPRATVPVVPPVVQAPVSVVNESAPQIATEPKTLYHGTTAEFDNFDITKTGSNTGYDNAKFGVFFLDNPEQALKFAQENGATGGKARVINASVDIKNPLDLTIEGIFSKEAQAPTVVKLLGGEDMSPKDALEYINENIGLGELGDLNDGLYGDIKNKKIMQDAGFDGIISSFGKDANGGVIKEYVAFSPEQIKTTPSTKVRGMTLQPTPNVENTKPLVNKTDIKNIIAGSEEFKANPTLTVDEDLNLTFDGAKTRFKIKASALGLDTTKVTPGDKITVDVPSLKAKGAPQQMRVMKGGQVFASQASPQGRKTITKIMEHINSNPDKPQEVPIDFKISDRAKEILKEFGITNAERSIPNRYLGLYKTGIKKVRVQSLYDITTVVHEAIHAIDDKIDFTKGLIDSTGRGESVRKRLTDIYEALYPGGKRTHTLKKRLTEGLAVLFENYFYDPISTSKTYPDLVNQFIKPTGTYYDPLFTKLLDRMNTLVEDYAKLSPEDKINTRIRTGDEIVRRDSGFSVAQRLVFEVFNRFEPFVRYSKIAGVSETWDDPIVQAFNLMNKNAIVANWVKGGSTPILLRNGNFRIEKGDVSNIWKLVDGKKKQWRVYLIARRVVETNNKINALKNEPIQDAKEIKRLEDIVIADDLSLADAQVVVKQYANVFSEAEKLYDGINKRLVDFAYENNLIDKDTADLYKSEKGYTSFKRFIDDDITSVGTMKTSSRSKVTGFKERTGSQLDIIDPMYSLVMNINEIIGKSLENTLWYKTYKLSLIKPEIGQRFEQIEARTSIDAKGNISFPQEKDPNIIRVFVDGKRKFFIAAPEFLSVAKTLRPKEFDAFVKLLRLPASTFTRLTTSANPVFAISNITVDQFSATMQTKTGFKPVVDPIMGLIDYIKSDDGMNTYLLLGGKRQTLASLYDLSPEDLSHKLLGGETKTEKFTSFFDSGLNILEFPSNTSEIITRLSEYKRAVAGGDSMSVAMYKASEVTVPFQLFGNMGGRFGQEVIKSIPYLNAAVEVIYKFGRSARDNPRRVGTMVAGLLATALTTAIIIMKYASEEQKRLLADQPVRNLSRYIYIPLPGGKSLGRIRIPEQIGALTGTVYLYVTSAYGKNKATFGDYVDSVTSAIPDQLNILSPKKMVLSYLPQAIKPSILTSSNSKTYPEVAPIVPQYVVDKSPSEQYNNYTSGVAKTMGGLLNMSPMLIDFWIKEQFGVVGGMLLGKFPQNPIKIQEKEFVMSGRSYNNFYDTLNSINMERAEMQKNKEVYTTEEIEKINVNNKIYNNVSGVLKDIREINTNQDIPEDIRGGAYDLLILLERSNINSVTDDVIGEVSDKIVDLKIKVNEFKFENNIN
jgi:hypothetical protein